MGRNRSRTSIQKVLLKVDTDESGFNAADAAFNRLADDFERVEERAHRALNPINAFDHAMDNLGGPVSQFAKEARRVDDVLEDQARTLKNTARVADDYGDAYRRASQDVEQFGDVATNISQISGLLRGAGLGGVADVGMVVADISDAVEGLRRLGPAVQEVGQTVANAVPGISSAGAGLAALGVAGLAVGAAAAAGALALDQWKRSNDEVVKGIEAWIAATSEGPTAETAQEAQNQVAEWNQAIADNADRVALLQRSYNELTNNFGVFTHVLDGLNARGLKSMREEIERLEAEALELNIRIAETRTEFGAVVDVTKELASAEGELLAKRERELEAVEAATAASEKWTAEQNRQAEVSRDAALEALDTQREQLSFLNELRSIADTSEEEAALEAASSARVEKLNQAFDKFATDTEKRISKITQSMQADIQKAQQEFMRESTQANAQFLEQERQQQEAHNLERLRMLEDLNDDLLGAEEANDVIRFIQIQRAGEKNLRRLDEDASLEQQQRSKEFIVEQKQRRIEFAQRVADIRAAGAQRIQAEREKLAERRQLLRQQIADERAALTQQIADTRAAAVAQVQMRRQQYFQELADLQRYNAQRTAIERSFQKNMARIAIESQRVQAAAMRRSLSGGSFSKRQTISGSGLTPFTKAGTATTQINVGSIGSKLSLGQVTNTLAGAFAEYQNAIIKARAK